MKNILTFDVEEHFQVEAFHDVISPDEWETRQSRLTMNMIKILDLLDQFNTKATFFILGWIANKYPHLVKMISSHGHEIASHGYGHQILSRLNKEQFYDDLSRSLELLERSSGKNICGYRAPTFSADRKKDWIWEVLLKCGIKYDSSIYPIQHDLYGDPTAPRFPYRMETEYGDLLEIPPTTYKFCGKLLPACGGGSFRLFPYWYTRKAIKAYNKAGYGAMIYLHPWEIDPAQPRETAAFKSRLRHYTNLNTVIPKLKKMLSEFEFGMVSEIYPDFAECNKTIIEKD